MFLLIQPFLEEGNLTARYDFTKRIYDPHNAFMTQTQIPGYVCPSDTGGGRKGNGDYGRSNYATCFGSTNYGGPNWSGQDLWASFPTAPLPGLGCPGNGRAISRPSKKDWPRVEQN